MTFTLNRGQSYMRMGSEDMTGFRVTSDKPIGVNSGRGFAFVDHIGDVYPSGFLPYRCGSVKEQSFREIYAEAPMMQALRDPSSYSGKCGVCEYHKVCGGCRARAHSMDDNHMGEEPLCTYIPAKMRRKENP